MPSLKITSEAISMDTINILQLRRCFYKKEILMNKDISSHSDRRTISIEKAYKMAINAFKKRNGKS